MKIYKFLYNRINRATKNWASQFFLRLSGNIFEIYRDNGENLGICSAITYIEYERNIHVFNWAISCRYFEIGLEEYILIYIYTLWDKRRITFTFDNTGFNGKTIELMEKYKKIFIKDNNDKNIYFIPDFLSLSDMMFNTNLKRYCNE